MPLIRILTLAALAYAAIYYIVSRVIYDPTRYPGGWWHTQTTFGACDIELHTSDNVRLNAWWVEPPADVPRAPVVTLYFHGNGGNIANRPGHLREIGLAGSPILVPDYRGYGKSERRLPTERGLYRDAEAAYDHLIAMGHPPERIVVLGESLGAAVAAHVAGRHPCAGLILECPFISLSAMAGHYVPLIGQLFASGYQTRRKIHSVHVPVLIIHGDRDRTVPYAMGRAVFAAANEPKSFWTVEGAAHLDVVTVAGARYHERLRAFYETVVPPDRAGAETRS